MVESYLGILFEVAVEPGIEFGIVFVSIAAWERVATAVADEVCVAETDDGWSFLAD